MSSQTLDLTCEGIENELYVFGGHTFDGFLYDMIPVLIFDASQDVVLELLDKLRLLVGKYVFEGLRRSVGANDGRELY